MDTHEKVNILLVDDQPARLLGEVILAELNRTRVGRLERRRCSA
jgi:hypothetical protein